MADISELELDALWDEFNGVVNMTSNELAAWLGAGGAGVAEEERAGRPSGETAAELGRRVLTVLQKRRVDLDDDDVALMYEVVDAVGAERERVRTAEAVRDPEWRYRMMSMGHDPVRAV